MKDYDDPQESAVASTMPKANSRRRRTAAEAERVLMANHPNQAVRVPYDDDAEEVNSPVKWEPPIEIDAVNVRPLPQSPIAGPVGEMIDAVALATETPRELALTFALGVLGTAAQKAYAVLVEVGYFEQLSIYTGCCLESGSRKTAVMQHMTRPVIDFEKLMLQESEADIKRQKSARETFEARVKQLRGQAANSKTSAAEAARLQNEIDETEANMPVVNETPRRIVSDCTPERLGSLMAANGERMGQISDEGGVFQMLGGRYSKMVNLDLHLQANSGSFIRIDRGSRPPVIMHHPALTMALAVQPNVIGKLAEHEEFRGRGLLARFLFMRPESRLGFRDLTPNPVPQSVERAYHATIVALLQQEVSENPRVLRLTPDAYFVWKDFQRRLESEMRPGQRLEHLRDWAGKLPGQTARIAGLMHIARYAHQSPENHQIDVDTMRNAVALADVLSDHSIAIFASIGADDRREIAQRILRWIRREQRTTFTQRECWQAVKGNVTLIESVEDLFPALDMLCSTNHIDAAPTANVPGKPGPKSKPFDVNPMTLARFGDCGLIPLKGQFENTSSSFHTPASRDGEIETAPQNPQDAEVME